MKYINYSRLIFFGLTILIFQAPIMANFPKFIRDMGIQPRDVYVAGSAVLGTAAIAIPTCMIWASKHHPAALAAKQLEQQKNEQRAQEKKAKELEDQKKLIESEKLKAQTLVQHVKHAYEAEINLLPNDRLEKNAFALIIKSKFNTEQTPLSHYHQTLTRDLDRLRNIENNMLDTEKNAERLQLISKLEHILRVHNLVIADAQKLEQQIAKIERRKEESEKRKIEKELLELEKYRLEIANIHDTKQVNAQIRGELQHVNEQMESLKLKLQNIERHQSIRAEQQTNSVSDLKSKIISLHEELKKLITTQTKTSETASSNLTKIFDDLKKSLEALGSFAAATSPQRPPFNPELLRPAPTNQPAPSFVSSAMQPIPVPVMPSAPPL